MPEGELFEWLSAALEQATSMSRLAARGTVRLLLKELGLNPGSLTRDEIAVLIRDQNLGDALRRRGVEDAETVCAQLVAAFRDLLSRQGSGAEEGEVESAEDIFKRLGWS